MRASEAKRVTIWRAPLTTLSVFTRIVFDGVSR